MTHLTANRGRALRWADSWPPSIMVGLVAAVAFSLSWRQWWRPVIEHDDWRQIVSAHWVPSVVHTTQLAADGRWLNYWVWLAGEPHLSERAVVLLFAAAWLLFTAVFVRSVTAGWWAAPLAVAVYATPMTVDVGYWPATLFPAMAALGIGSALLRLTRHHLRWHLVVLAATCCLTVLGYPPFALMALVLLVALHHREGWQRLLVLAAAFVASYAGTVLLTFTLNDLRFGDFGLKIADWRHPTPLTGIGSLLQHLHVGGGDWKLVIEAILIPLLVGLIALVAAAADPRLRRSVLVAALAFGLALALDLAPTILHGVSNPFRSMGWVWLFLVLVIGWAVASVQAAVRATAAVALVAIAAWGALYSANSVIDHQRFQSAIAKVESEAVALATRTGGQVIIAPRAPLWTRLEAETAEQFRGALAKGDPAMHARLCTRRCTHFLLRYVRRHHIEQSVFYEGGLVVVRLPNALFGRALDVLPQPDWLQPVPWPRSVRQ